MSHDLQTGVHRPRPWGTGLVGSSLALLATVTVAVLLWAAAAGQVAPALGDAGGPVTQARVVACPGGAGLCVAPTASLGAALPLAVQGPLGPVAGDSVTITTAGGVATLGGGHAWVNLTLTLVLAAVLTGWSVRWWRRVLLAGARPVDAEGPGEEDVRRGRGASERHVA